jgi:hypothetical protein
MTLLKKLEMPERKKKGRWLLKILGVIALLILAGVIYLLIVSRINPPHKTGSGKANPVFTNFMWKGSPLNAES